VDGLTGVWMEFVRGCTLEAELADRGPFDEERLKRVATELGSALAAVHDAGLVHRDVKATNVMLDGDGRVVLGDFGTGRLHEANDAQRSGLAGTPSYLAISIVHTVRTVGRGDEAIDHAGRALALTGDAERPYVTAWANLILGITASDGATKDAHFRRAENAFHELLQRQPDHLSALAGLADLYREMGQPVDELRTCLRIGEVRPNAFG
jgi:serine/threonine protein kinase